MTVNVSQTAVYTKVRGKLAKWVVDTQNVAEAIDIVKNHIAGPRNLGAVLAVVTKTVD
jgi:hypothetical protein